MPNDGGHNQNHVTPSNGFWLIAADQVVSRAGGFDVATGTMSSPVSR